MHARTCRGIAMMAAIAVTACGPKGAEHSCTEPAAQAAALDYVRSDLIKFFGTQGAEGMDPARVSLEGAAVQARDEEKKETTCTATIAYAVGDRNQSVAVVYAWAPGGREGDEYSARIWLATP